MEGFCHGEERLSWIFNVRLKFLNLVFQLNHLIFDYFDSVWSFNGKEKCINQMSYCEQNIISDNFVRCFFFLSKLLNIKFKYTLHMHYHVAQKKVVLYLFRSWKNQKVAKISRLLYSLLNYIEKSLSKIRKFQFKISFGCAIFLLILINFDFHDEVQNFHET